VGLGDWGSICGAETNLQGCFGAQALGLRLVLRAVQWGQVVWAQAVGLRLVVSAVQWGRVVSAN
jgi:hypothetical protein